MACSFRLQRFCFCCTLRTGTIIIGTLGWVLTILKLSGIVYVSTDTLTKGPNKGDDEIECRTIVLPLCFGVFSLFASILLIVGVYKKKKRFLLPWLILQCIECILLSVAFILCFFLIFFVPAKDTKIFAIVLVILLVICSLCWYFWLSVWSHYKELNNARSSLNVYYTPTSHSKTSTYNKTVNSLT